MTEEDKKLYTQNPMEAYVICAWCHRPYWDHDHTTMSEEYGRVRRICHNE